MSPNARRDLVRGRLRLRVASSTASSAKYRIVTVRFGFHGTASSIRPSSSSTWSMPSSFTNATQSALSTGRAETSFIARRYLGPADSTTSLGPSKTGSGSAATATVQFAQQSRQLLCCEADIIEFSRGHRRCAVSLGSRAPRCSRSWCDRTRHHGRRRHRGRQQEQRGPTWSSGPATRPHQWGDGTGAARPSQAPAPRRGHKAHARPIALIDSPTPHRSHNSRLCASDNPRRPEPAMCYLPTQRTSSITVALTG